MHHIFMLMKQNSKYTKMFAVRHPHHFAKRQEALTLYTLCYEYYLYELYMIIFFRKSEKYVYIDYRRARRFELGAVIAQTNFQNRRKT